MQLQTFYIILSLWTVKSYQPLARKPAPLHSLLTYLTFQRLCLNIAAAKWTYGCGLYSLNQIFIRVGMIFKHCSPECTVASGSARRLACSATSARRLFPPSPPPARWQACWQVCMTLSQPVGQPTIWSWYVSVNRVLCGRKLTKAPTQGRFTVCCNSLFSLCNNCVLTLTSSMGLTLEKLLFFFKG